MSAKTTHVVLAGAGHAHLHLAARARELDRAGIRLTLIDPGAFWYSGLATGMLAGQYDAPADQVDPARLIQAGGGAFLRDRLIQVDPGRRLALLASGDALQYDCLSLNIGSEVDTHPIPGADEHAWTVKPIRNLWRLRTQLEERLRTPSTRPPRIVIVGAGPTGCEVAACSAALARRCGRKAEVVLVSRADSILTGFPPGAAQAMRDALTRRGVEILTGSTVQRIEAGPVILDDGRRLRADLTLVATGLRAPRVLEHFGVPLGREGAVRVKPTLQSTGDDRIFAAGDCASLEGHSLPQLGVFGVRQAPVLRHNLVAGLLGRQLQSYRPQKRWLMILNLGDGSALAIYGRFHWRGRLSFRVKDWIDRRFLAQYR